MFTSMAKRLINTSRNERVTLQVYDTWLQMFLSFGLRRKYCLTRSTLSSDTHGSPALFPLQRHPVVWNCWYQRLMLLGDGGSLLNCRRYARWTETTDSCFTNCSTQNAFCSGVAIMALLRHRPREKRRVGLRMRTKLEHLPFRSIWDLISVCLLKAVMADWNCSNHFNTPCILSHMKSDLFCSVTSTINPSLLFEQNKKPTHISVHHMHICRCKFLYYHNLSLWLPLLIYLLNRGIDY